MPGTTELQRVETMTTRLAFGAAEIGLYMYRVVDPTGSYAAIFEASGWVSGFVLEPLESPLYVRNFVNLLLVEQLDGFLLGVIAATLISALLGGLYALCKRSVRRALRLFPRPMSERSCTLVPPRPH